MKKPVKREVGLRLKQIREKFGLTQTRMASDLVVARSTYSLNESGTYFPTVATLMALGNIKNVSVDWLLFGIGGMNHRGSRLNEEVFEFIDGNDNIQELLYLMKSFPLLRKDIVNRMEQFKEEHPDLTEEALKKKNSK